MDYKFQPSDRVRSIGTEHFDKTGTVSFSVPGNGNNPHVNVQLDNGEEALMPEWELEAE